MQKRSATISNIRKELETVSGDMVNIMKCLEVLENSIYFSVDRKDKDMTKPHAAATEIILKMVDNCQDAVMTICEELEAIADKEA